MEIRVERGVQVALTHLSSQKPRRPQACKWLPCWADQDHHCPLCPGLQEASLARPGPRPTLPPASALHQAPCSGTQVGRKVHRPNRGNRERGPEHISTKSRYAGTRQGRLVRFLPPDSEGPGRGQSPSPPNMESESLCEGNRGPHKGSSSSHDWPEAGPGENPALDCRPGCFLPSPEAKCGGGGGAI